MRLETRETTDYVIKSKLRMVVFLFIASSCCCHPSQGINPMEALEDYCNKFIDLLKPYICRAINFPSTSSTTERWPNGTTTEVWDEDCSCDLNCSTGQNSDESNTKEDGAEYTCTSCGSECPVNTTIPPRCSCAVIGGRKKARCRCTANCASFRYDLEDADDGPSTSCIFNVNRLYNGILADSSPDHTCECTKSKSAENNTRPEFVCVCQPSH